MKIDYSVVFLSLLVVNIYVDIKSYIRGSYFGNQNAGQEIEMPSDFLIIRR